MAKTNNTEPEYDSLTARLWQTKGTRFSADERLRSKHKLSVFSLAILTLYLIALSIVDMLDPAFVPEQYQEFVPVMVLFLSVFILVISLIENSKGHLLQADKMHQCALEIQSLYHNLDLLRKNDKDSFEERKEILEEYNNILKKYPNHEERAYWIFRANNYREKDINFWVITHPFFKMPVSKILLLWYWLADFWLYLFFILSPLLFLWYWHHMG